MALLLQCLREIRIRSGDLDLLPPTAEGDIQAVDWKVLIGSGFGHAVARTAHNEGHARSAPQGIGATSGRLRILETQELS